MRSQVRLVCRLSLKVDIAMSVLKNVPTGVEGSPEVLTRMIAWADDARASWELLTTVVVFFGTFFTAYCYSGPLLVLVRMVCVVLAGVSLDVERTR